ncbi:MAG: site-2 protease family protein [Mariprofundaceae bacterium]|nr:site-2 protease family protein [Mariprofundaceae bacterium]
MNAIITGISIWAIPVLFAVVLHEVAHGRMAYYLGDDTSKMLGRLTLNPLKHIDPIGTIAIPLMLIVLQAPFLFGYAKPVPVNFRKLHSPRRDMVLVALAGPLTNLVLALLSTVVLFLVWQLPIEMKWLIDPVSLMCQASIVINIVLCVFNLLPIPPLDGGRVAVGLLPYQLACQLSKVEPYGFFIIIALMISGVLEQAAPFLMGLVHTLIGWAQLSF